MTRNKGKLSRKRFIHKRYIMKSYNHAPLHHLRPATTNFLNLLIALPFKLITTLIILNLVQVCQSIEYYSEFNAK